MQKSDIRILIVEDDVTFGPALSEAVRRNGYTPVLTAKPDEALSILKIQSIQAVLVDCMLPKIGGVDLAKKMRDMLGKDLMIILMSGIFKDKNFAKEMMNATGAIAFLTKPFQMEELFQTIDNKLSHLIDIPLIPIHEIFSRAQLTTKDKINAINDSDPVHGFDLPWLYSLLLDRRVTGHLNIITADGEVAGVGFQKGQIVQVNLKDTQSYFGMLLVEQGFITTQDLEAVLKEGTSKTKRMGERLVEANVLSPHAVTSVMTAQQGIRLAKTISNTSLKVNFIDAEEMREDVQIDAPAYHELLHDWIRSKIAMEWLKSFYLPWMNNAVKPVQDFNTSHPILKMPIFETVPGLVDKLISGKTLEQITNELDLPDDSIIRAVHFLLVTRLICFGELKKANMDFENQKRRLQKLFTTLQKQTHFERLGVSPKAKENEIKRTYHELAKVLHPDKLPTNSPADVVDLGKRVFALLSEAYEILSNQKSKENYIKELEHGQAELVLKAEALIEQARGLLSKGDITKAKSTLEEAKALAPPSSELRLLLLWSTIKNPAFEKMPREEAVVREELAKIPPEDRHNPTYYFVKGLHQKATKDIDGALKSFEHTVSIAPDFIDARRELNLLKAAPRVQQSNDLLKADLKDVVGMIFKKKK